MKVYFDNAATTPIDAEVFQAMTPYFTEFFGNPSSTHSFGRKTKTAIENARRSIAALLNCSPSEVFFTSGGTEADNLAIKAAVSDLECKHIITSKIEHSAVLKTVQKLSDAGKIRLSFVNLLQNGDIDLAHLEQLLNSTEKTLVTLMHANNEIGNILPIKAVSSLCLKYSAYFHSDTVQTMGHYAFDLQDLKIHFLNASAHKFHGPKGIGFFYCNKSVKINPSITGGGQERGLRGGTENIYGIVGMSKALEICYRDLKHHQEHVQSIKSYMIDQLIENIPGIEFNGNSRDENSLYTVLNVTFPENQNSDMLLFLLDLEGIACSGGSACSSGAAKGSHVLEEIHALKQHRASLRFSFSKFSTRAEVDYTVAKLRELCLEQVPV